MSVPQSVETDSGRAQLPWRKHLVFRVGVSITEIAPAGDVVDFLWLRPAQGWDKCLADTGHQLVIVTTRIDVAAGDNLFKLLHGVERVAQSAAASGGVVNCHVVAPPIPSRIVRACADLNSNERTRAHVANPGLLAEVLQRVETVSVADSVFVIAPDGTFEQVRIRLEELRCFVVFARVGLVRAGLGVPAGDVVDVTHEHTKGVVLVLLEPIEVAFELGEAIAFECLVTPMDVPDGKAVGFVSGNFDLDVIQTDTFGQLVASEQPIQFIEWESTIGGATPSIAPHYVCVK